MPKIATIAIEYPGNVFATFTLGYKAMRYSPFNDQLKQFHGDKARLDVGREWYAVYPGGNAIELKPSVDVRQPKTLNASTRSHIRNFLECVRSRKEPNAPVEASNATNCSRNGYGLAAKWTAAALDAAARKAEG